ncbi:MULTISPECIES: hypothetical protein [Vibrio]
MLIVFRHRDNFIPHIYALIQTT